MAINYPDFLNAPSAESPWKNAFESVLKGYQMSQEPAKMKEEQTARVLANKLKNLEAEHKPKEYALSDQEKGLGNALKSKALEHYEEKFQMSRDLNKARIDKLNARGATNIIKPNGKIANIAWVKEQLENPNIDPAYAKQLTDALKDAAEHEETIIARGKDVVAGNSFDKLPTNDKKQSVALMKGMGVDPVEAVSYLRQTGHTPSTYAKEKGIDIHTVTPDYAANEQNIKDAQRASAYIKEINVLERHINEGLGKYQNKIMQIADAAQGTNPEQQAKALAGRALIPELNALRLKINGGNIGIEALNELKHTSLGELNIIESLVDEKTFRLAQEYINKWIIEAGEVRIKSLIGNSMLKSDQEKSAEKEAQGGKVYNLATGSWEDE
jgi:hypothetical protein